MTDGAIAIRSPAPGRVVVYELVKPSGVQLRLGKLPRTMAGQRLKRAWILLTRNRRIELKFPDVTQDGDIIALRPAEMATTVGYEIELGPP